MTTSTGQLERTFDWFLDRDGDLYGDEQERLRWYEAIAVAAGVQWIALPWLAVVCLAVWGEDAAGATLVLLLGLYLTMMIVTVYVSRRRVRTMPEHWSGKRIGITALSLIPYVVLIGQFLWIWGPDDDRSEVVGGLCGAVAGIAGGLVALQVTSRRRRAREWEPEDAD